MSADTSSQPTAAGAARLPGQPAKAAPPKKRGHKLGIGFAILVALIVFLILIWDWNWFRPLIETQASAALNRRVTLQHFDLKLRWHPTVIFDGLAVANPDEFPKGGDMASIRRLAVTVDPWAWFDENRRAHILAVEIDAPVGDLRPGPSGKANYLFDLPASPPPDPDAKPLQVDVESLVIRDGDIHIVEPKVKADFRLKVRTVEAADGEPRIRIDADGKYADAPITGRFIGGSVLKLRDPARPYPVDLQVSNGDTEVKLIGTLLDPVHLGGARLKLDFRGANLADLYPLTGVPLPPSPPYSLSGLFDYAGGGTFRFRDFKGLYGKSDLGGDVTVNIAGERRKVVMVAHSSQVNWTDLAGLVGGTPGDKDTPNQTPEQKAERKAEKKDGKVLPDTPIALPRIRAADLDVTYKVDRINAEIVPFDRMEMHVITEDGLLMVKPVKLGVGKGDLRANIELDGRQDVVHMLADLDFRQLDFSKIVDKMSLFKGTGTLAGSARIDARGNSLAQMLGGGDGDLKLFMAGGDVSAILVNLAGLDVGNTIVSALGIPRRADLRCLVVDMGMDKGQVQTRTLLADTTEANMIGSGSIDLTHEQIDYKLHTEPKRLNVGSLASPILIKGPLADPSIRPEVGPLAAKGAAATVLGVVLTPLAALLPTIQLGLGEDNDCVTLLKGVDAPPSVQQQAPPPEK